MRVVSHIPAGSLVLEQYGSGAWRPVSARRDLILLVYPRTVGAAAPVVSGGVGDEASSGGDATTPISATPSSVQERQEAVGVQPVLVTSRDTWAEVAGFSDTYPSSGYTRMPCGADESVRPLLAGTMLYIPGLSVAGDQSPGRLWVVAQMFVPLAFSERPSDPDGEFVVQVRPLLRFDSPAVRRRHDRDVYDLATSTKQLAYDPADFWVVEPSRAEDRPGFFRHA